MNNEYKQYRINGETQREQYIELTVYTERRLTASGRGRDRQVTLHILYTYTLLSLSLSLSIYIYAYYVFLFYHIIVYHSIS